MLKKLLSRYFLVDKDIYLFQIDENNIVTNKIKFNEKICGKKVNKWIKKSGEKWYISEVKVSGQYYPEYGDEFTAEKKPLFKKPELWHIDLKTRLWVPKDHPYPNDGKKYQFCEDCEKWIEKRCC